MINILLFMFPAGFGLKIKDEYFKEKMDIKDYILTYAKYVVITNFIVLAILFVYSSGTYTSFDYLLNNINFVFKYLMISTFVAAVVPFVDEYLKKNISIKLRLKKIEDKNVKKKK